MAQAVHVHEIITTVYCLFNISYSDARNRIQFVSISAALESSSLLVVLAIVPQTRTAPLPFCCVVAELYLGAETIVIHLKSAPTNSPDYDNDVLFIRPQGKRCLHTWVMQSTAMSWVCLFVSSTFRQLVQADSYLYHIYRYFPVVVDRGVIVRLNLPNTRL